MQLPLDLDLIQHCTFDNFVVSQAHEQAVFMLQQLAQGATHPPPVMTYLYGDAYAGKSHLLQAMCREAMASGITTLYMPMQQARHWPIDVLQDVEAQLICLDDVGAVAGNADWERTLYSLVNEAQMRQASIVVADRLGLEHLGVQLADLRSRLSWGSTFQLTPPVEIDAISIVRDQALARGLQMPERVQQYLLRHYHRDLSTLLRLLDALDHHSMAHKRQLTVPFVKEVITTVAEA